jgi:catalase
MQQEEKNQNGAGKSNGAANNGNGEQHSNELTTRQGHPVSDNQNVRTVGRRGPTTLENYQFLEKITHFDRERIPERVVHARGAGAHGYFEAYGTVGSEPVSKYTRAKLFQQKGKRTPVLFVFHRLSMAGIHRKPSATPAALPPNFIRKMATGTWWQQPESVFYTRCHEVS